MTAISNNDIARAIHLSSKDKSGKELSDLLANVTRFLFRKRLVSKIPDILERLEKIIDKVEKRVSVKVWSARALHENVKRELTHSLKARYKAEHIVLQENIQPNLLGGMRIEVGDEVIDISMRNKISKLQEHLTRDI